MKLKEYTKWMLIGYVGMFLVVYFFVSVEETRSNIVGIISSAILALNIVQFLKHKKSTLYKYKMKEVLEKEASLVYLGFLGLALGFLSDSAEPLVLGLFLSCGMLNLKFVIMHFQWENKIKKQKTI